MMAEGWGGQGTWILKDCRMLFLEEEEMDTGFSNEKCPLPHIPDKKTEPWRG